MRARAEAGNQPMALQRRTFQDLIALLAEESEIYEAFGKLLEDERDALMHLRASELGEITSQKETLALRIKALDESRKVMSEQLGRRFDLERDQVTIKALREFATPGESARLEEIRLELRERALECKRINDENARAARVGLDLIQNASEFLVGQADPAGKIYQKKGGYASEARRRTPAIVSKQV
jgi:flagellar biosynthesis/type III secretory pathway chaperone